MKLPQIRGVLPDEWHGIKQTPSNLPLANRQLLRRLEAIERQRAPLRTIDRSLDGSRAS